MAEYRVLIPKQAGKRLDDLPHDVLRRIYRRLKDLETNPRPSWATQLRGEPPGWRFRVGAYRVLYEIDDEERSVFIRDAGHRRDRNQPCRRTGTAVLRGQIGVEFQHEIVMWSCTDCDDRQELGPRPRPSARTPRLACCGHGTRSKTVMARARTPRRRRRPR